MKLEIRLSNQIIKELHELIRREQYVDLYCVFPDTVEEELQSLTLNLKQAKNLLWAAELENSKAYLKYPYSIEDAEPYDPEHEAQFDDVQHFYEKVNFYLGLAIKEFEELKNQEGQVSNS